MRRQIVGKKYRFLPDEFHVFMIYRYYFGFSRYNGIKDMLTHIQIV